MLVERECPADVESLDQGKTGAIDDAERLIGPFLRDLPPASEIFCDDTHDLDDAAIEAIPKSHRRRAPEPSPDEAPSLDDDVITGREVVMADCRPKSRDRFGVMVVGKIG